MVYEGGCVNDYQRDPEPLCVCAIMPCRALQHFALRIV